MCCDLFDLAVDGKQEEGRPSLLSKLLSSGSVPELGHSSSSEGEKDFTSPEWDIPVSKISVRKCKPESYPRLLVMPDNQFDSNVLVNQKQIVFSRSPSRR